MTLSNWGDIASITVLFLFVVGILIKVREAYQEIPGLVQGSSGGCGGFNTYYEVAFILYKIKMRGRLTGTLSHYKWK